MKKYLIESCESTFEILADEWAVSESGLKFAREKRIIAWFVSWDSWREVNDS